MSTHGTQRERAALRDAARHINALIAAAQGDESRCGSFSTTFAPLDKNSEHDMAIRQHYADAVRLYVGTWIQPMLNAALASMDGEPSREDLELLESAYRPY